MKQKFFNDIIHGTIKLSNIAVSIIDTYEFQRLRNIKQLSTVNYVFPSAVHTRFEHSIGVAHLAKKLLKILILNQNNLNITERDILRIEIAGLCHDLGHGPFSHTFDNEFLKNHPDYNSVIFKNHEERSIIILKLIIKKYNIELNDEDIKHISWMIYPEFYEEEINKLDKYFLYTIVSNKDNGLDVDKFDYLARDSFYCGIKIGCEFSRIFSECIVIDNIIVFSEKIKYNILDIFNARNKLHLLIYNHRVVKSIEFMILDLIRLMDNYNNEITKFCK